MHMAWGDRAVASAGGSGEAAAVSAGVVAGAEAGVEDLGVVGSIDGRQMQ
jgi:hypothetical protein